RRHRPRQQAPRGRQVPGAPGRPRGERQRARSVLADRRAAHVTDGGATPRRRLRRALGRALLALSLVWSLLAAAFAARDHVAVHGLPSAMRIAFGDELLAPRWPVVKGLFNAFK